MNYFYITGTSRGIGKAIAEELLKNDENFIVGISRGKSIENKNYKHFFVDLNKTDDIEKIVFEEHQNAGKIVLINNSAILGEVKQLGKKSNSDIIKSYNINIIAPIIIMNKFIAKYQKNNCEKIILNISSGAARYPVTSWSTYCSTKAALDMVSEVTSKEQTEEFGEKCIKIFSVAPGIVDTKLQDEIREVKSDDFSKVEIFKAYKDDNKLDNPLKTAKALIYIIFNNNKFDKVCLDVRNLNGNE
jgi:benzil reductase ((S)-benzoin forming)